MDKVEDGGSAFPVPEGSENHVEFGMSLRDWFAGQALIGLVANAGNSRSAKGTARVAYVLADTMLEARENENNGKFEPRIGD
jgi:hypothetical protein